VGEVLYKLVRRITPWLLNLLPYAVETEVKVAPYGGMMFHNELLRRIGLPDEAFFLYVDDYEFSNRIGKIYLAADAIVYDMDRLLTAPQSHLFMGRLNNDHFGRLYYSVRNMVYFECYGRPHSGVVYGINRLVFMALLKILALKTGKREAYEIILTAIRDGENASLGAHPAYEL
jgi:GT2 family glycosyltransferase